MISKSKIRVALVGDIYFGNTYPKLDPGLKELFKECDSVIGNLETPICDARPTQNPDILRTSLSEAQGEKIFLSSAPGSECILADWGVTAVSLANNHIFDCDLDGFTQTTDRLEQVGISHFGVGKDLSEAAIPYIISFGNRRIGFIAGADSRSTSYLASRREFGCNPVQKPEIRDQIREVRDQVDWIVVLPHWGLCGKSYPELSSFLLGQYLLDEGADVVAGHHSHVVHGSREIKDNTYLAYSLGNFYFAPFTVANKEKVSCGREAMGAILILEFSPDDGKLSHQWHFTKQDGQQIKSDNTKERHQSHAVLSEYIKKTGSQYVQALRKREAKELATSSIRRFYRPIKPLWVAVERIVKTTRIK